MLRKTPPVAQPMVHTHPVTGNRSLFLDPTTTIGVEGMSDAEGIALVDRLRDACTRPEAMHIIPRGQQLQSAVPA